MREIRIPGSRRVLRVSCGDESVRRQVDDEIRFHLGARVEELIRLGASEAAARRRAEAEFGDVRESRRELMTVDRRRLGHQQREETFMSFIEDLRYAARGLLRRPALLVVTTLALSIGIAANAIMFGVVDQLLLRPPAHVANPESLRRVYFLFDRDGMARATATTTYPVIAALRRGLPESGVVAMSHVNEYSLDAGVNAREVRVQLVSGNFFRVLGTQPAMGRGFARDEDQVPQGVHVAVVSDGFWRQQLGESRDALGRELLLHGKPFTVIGVAPRGFSGIDRDPVDVWVPISAMASDVMSPTWYSEPNAWWLEAFARLPADASSELVTTQATAAYRAEMKAWGDRLRDTTSSVALGSIIGTRTPEGLSRDSKISLWLMGVSVIVLLIACANVANLLIARTFQRRREIAVRLALGVSRSRLLRMLLTEAGVLAAISAAMALAIAFVGSRLVQQLLLPGIVWSDSVLDARVLAFTLVVTVICIMLAGIAPALQGIGTKVSDGLKASTSQMAGSRNTLRYALLVIQAALSFVLLIGAGLFVRSLRNVINRDVGIDLQRVLLVSMDLGRVGFSRAQIEDIYRRGGERLRELPGVASAATVRQSVPSQSGNAISFKVPGAERIRFDGGGPYYSVVPGSFFGTLGTSILRGRNFTDAEKRVPNRAMIVSRIIADGYWPGQDPIGKCVKLGSDTTCSSIVGVVENVMLFSLVRDDRAMLYLPPAHSGFGNRPPAALVVRSSGDPETLTPLVQKEIQALEPSMPFVSVQPYIEKVASQLRPWRLGATMFTAFGVIALIIAAVGLYSVMAYWVSQRTHEIGVRMALGAQRSDVVRLVAWQSSRAIVIGLVIGGFAAAFASRWVVDLLYEISPRDPVIYALAALVLAAAALVASVVPARRSAAVDPALAIRSE